MKRKYLFVVLLSVLFILSGCGKKSSTLMQEAVLKYDYMGLEVSFPYDKSYDFENVTVKENELASPVLTFEIKEYKVAVTSKFFRMNKNDFNSLKATWEKFPHYKKYSFDKYEGYVFCEVAEDSYADIRVILKEDENNYYGISGMISSIPGEMNENHMSELFETTNIKKVFDDMKVTIKDAQDPVTLAKKEEEKRVAEEKKLEEEVAKAKEKIDNELKKSEEEEKKLKEKLAKDAKKVEKEQKEVEADKESRKNNDASSGNNNSIDGEKNN